MRSYVRSQKRIEAARLSKTDHKIRLTFQGHSYELYQNFGGEVIVLSSLGRRIKNPHPRLLAKAQIQFDMMSVKQVMES